MFLFSIIPNTLYCLFENRVKQKAESDTLRASCFLKSRKQFLQCVEVCIIIKLFLQSTFFLFPKEQGRMGGTATYKLQLPTCFYYAVTREKYMSISFYLRLAIACAFINSFYVLFQPLSLLSHKYFHLRLRIVRNAAS